MTEYKIEDSKKCNMRHTLIWLEYANKLIAFIHIYGPLYDENYFSYILKLHNLIEKYLSSVNYNLLHNDNNYISILLHNDYVKIISKIYTLYKKCIFDGKTDKETYDALRLVLQQLPAYSIGEVDERYNRHTKHR